MAPDQDGRPGHAVDPDLRLRILHHCPDAWRWSTDLWLGVRVPPSATTTSGHEPGIMSREEGRREPGSSL